MTVASQHMKRLYNRLQTVGYTKKYINSLLPDWWDDELAGTPAGVQQASLILGQRFGVRAETLWTDDVAPALRLPQGIRFKHRQNVDTDDLSIACAVAHSLAKIVLRAFPAKPLPDFYTDAGELRKQLLIGKKWITFKDVLVYCLNLGIPVIYLKHLPDKAKKMDGLAFMQDDRPVIVLTQKRTYGYMLFDLAHELGHISLGHVTAEHSIIDQKIDSEAEDEAESAANRFALELLTGNPGCRIVPNGRNLNGNQLAQAAILFGEKHQIDPMHIALNYAHTQEKVQNQKRWPVANHAVNLIAKETASDQDVLRHALLESLDLNELSEDDYALLQTHIRGNAD